MKFIIYTEKKYVYKDKKFLKLSQDSGNWWKNTFMVFDQMVNLCMETFFNFIAFNIWVTLEYYCHFKKCIKFYNVK